MATLLLLLALLLLQMPEVGDCGPPINPHQLVQQMWAVYIPREKETLSTAVNTAPLGTGFQTLPLTFKPFQYIMNFHPLVHWGFIQVNGIFA